MTSSLLERYRQDLQLAGLAETTRETYVAAVARLEVHFQKSPDEVTDEELREYFLHQRNVKQASSSTATIALCAIKFFVEKTLKRPWTSLEFVRPPREKKLPVILSPEEVHRILAAVVLQRFRVCLVVLYSCGLRLSEGIQLRVPDIDSARGLIHVRHGKGGKDRYVPLPQQTLLELRGFWKTHRNPVFLFPAPGHRAGAMSVATQPMFRSGVQRAFQMAVSATGIHKEVSCHSLRHNAARRIMPTEAGNGRKWVDPWLIRAALSEVFQEGQEAIAGVVAASADIHGGGLGERCLLESKVGVEVHLGGLHRLVAEPKGDDGAIDPVLKEVHGC